MFFTILTILVNSALNTGGIENTPSNGYTIRNTMFTNNNNKQAIKLTGGSGDFYIEYCFFNGCKGCNSGSAIYAQTSSIPNIKYNCLYDCQTTSSNGGDSGALYIEPNYNSDDATVIHYLTSRSCHSSYQPLLFRSKTTSRLLPIQFHNSNVSLCSSKSDGVVYFQDYYIDVLYCNYAFNTGNDGLFFKYDPNFSGRDCGYIHNCNFNDNKVSGVDTIYYNSYNNNYIEYIYLNSNTEVYTIDYTGHVFLPSRSIYCDKFTANPNNLHFASTVKYYEKTIKTSTREPHTFYRTAICYADITAIPTPKQTPTPYSPTPYIPTKAPDRTPLITPKSTSQLDIRKFLSKIPNVRHLYLF